MNKLITELEAWANQYGGIPKREILAMLSRHPASQEAQDGLREYLANQIKHIEVDGPFQDGLRYAYQNVLDWCNERPVPQEAQDRLRKKLEKLVNEPHYYWPKTGQWGIGWEEGWDSCIKIIKELVEEK